MDTADERVLLGEDLLEIDHDTSPGFPSISATVYMSKRVGKYMVLFTFSTYTFVLFDLLHGSLL